jgi:hypothetical protein
MIPADLAGTRFCGNIERSSGIALIKTGPQVSDIKNNTDHD